MGTHSLRKWPWQFIWPPASRRYLHKLPCQDGPCCNTQTQASSQPLKVLQWQELQERHQEARRELDRKHAAERQMLWEEELQRYLAECAAVVCGSKSSSCKTTCFTWRTGFIAIRDCPTNQTDLYPSHLDLHPPDLTNMYCSLFSVLYIFVLEYF